MAATADAAHAAFQEDGCAARLVREASLEFNSLDLHEFAPASVKLRPGQPVCAKVCRGRWLT